MDAHLKTCIKCRVEKATTPENFRRNKRSRDGVHWYCKACQYADRQANRERYLAYERASHERNKVKRNAYTRSRWVDPEFRKTQLEVNKRWHQANADRKRSRNQQWRAENPDKVRGYLADAYARDPLRYNVSAHIAFCLKRSGSSKAGRRFESLLGYAVETLKQHIERQFSRGMSWGNHGTVWELDHIIPLTLFKFSSADDPEFRAAWALTNLRPLAKIENRSKGGRRATLL